MTIRVNVLMVAATPVIGAHYVIDIIAGVAVAAGSILLAKHLFQIHASWVTAMNLRVGRNQPARA